MECPKRYVMKHPTTSSVCDTSYTTLYPLSDHTTIPPPSLHPHPTDNHTVLTELSLTYSESTSSPLPFFHLLTRLKTTHRAGWRRFGISNCESISDHMYRMSIITMMAPSSLSSKLDMAKCTRMALIHDMAESLVGDITPVDPVSKEEKSRRESETMDYICDKLLGKMNGGLNGREVREIWQEYEDSKTQESLFVHDVDKIELLLQMVEYERESGCEKDLGEFTWVAQKILSEEVRAWARDVFRERQQLWKEAGKTCSWRADTEPKE
jgi:putative hydrolase of HD superfamily